MTTTEQRERVVAAAITPEERRQLVADMTAGLAQGMKSAVLSINAILAYEAALEEAEARATEFEARWNHVREMLAEQADARLDPAMPLLTAKVVEELKSESEAWHAMADDRDGRVVAHGLGLLCDWQDKARAALQQGAPDHG